jgi:tetratricopeptide (TPR) repeat protein
MKNGRLGVLMALLAVVSVGYVAWSVSVVYAEEAKANADKAAADVEFGKKNYARAVELYKKALTTLTRSHADAPAIEERLRDCWLGMRKWDDAITEAKATIEARPGTFHAARAGAFIGRIASNMPHYYYKKDNVISRGEWVQDGEYHWTEYQDYRDASAAFEAALVIYEKLQASADAELAKQSVKREDLVADAVSAYVDHAALLENSRWSIPNNDEQPLVWQIDPRRETVFQTTWSHETKTRWLYHIAVTRAGQAKLGDVEAVARYKRAAYHARRHGAVWSQQWTDANFRQFPEGEDPFHDLRWILQSQSEHPIADEAAFLLGRSLEASGRYVDAIAAFRDVAKRYPKSNWVSDAQAAIQQIERGVLSFNYQRSASFRPGEVIALSAWSRNLPDILFTARELDLTALMSDKSVPEDYTFGLNGIAPYLEAHPELKKAVLGREVTRWTVDTADTGEHRYHRSEIEVPELGKKEGAYYVEAKGLGLSHGVVILVSNLGVIEKVDGKQTIAWVVDLETGLPVDGAVVAIREHYYLNNARNGGVHAQFTMSDKDGLTSKPHFLAGRRNNRGWSYGVEIFAATGDRYAMTQRTSQPWWNYDDGVVYRTLIETDRPVYRPEQEVFFKATLRRKDGGEWKTPSGLATQVLIQDPKGNKLFDQRLTASENGTVSGSILLEKEPPLGEYSVQVWPVQHPDWRSRGSYSFAVEEYKKPEYEVSVKFAKPQVKVGETVGATINAWYYFGAPVVGAEVKYTIQRKFYYNQYSFPREYDWLYGRRYMKSWYNSYDYWTTELVAQGTGTTDAEGNVKVDIDSSVAGGKWPEQDHTYIVSAEVTDASRRVINGAGNLNVTRQAYYAYLDNKRGYARPGDTVKVELRTVNASGGPVTVEGKMSISRVFMEPDPANEGQLKRRTVLREEAPIATDKAGRTYFEWQSDQAGLWEFRYTGKDEWGGEVTNFVDVWVADPNGRDLDFHFTSIELLTEKETYVKGETLNLLVHAVAPDTAVLLTEEANAEILNTRVVRLKGKSALVEVGLTDRHVPNFFFKGLAVFRGQMWTADREVFVPPSDKFLTVNVTPNRKEYLPGETASFDVQTLDKDGKPVAAEVSFGVVDESVYYIVPSRVQDPKKLYYGDRRGRSISESNSRTWASSPAAEDRNQYAEFKTHGIPLGWTRAFTGGRPARKCRRACRCPGWSSSPARGSCRPACR